MQAMQVLYYKHNIAETSFLSIFSQEGGPRFTYGGLLF